ncbi:histidinol-phosphate transaminase [Nocardia cyriacigeorgica]|uniref:histidinol-phosphate transaminase n=1 Tax=Nocardia cyriacigeorgica TaxID=135487 RepID=UPI001895175A|nr:histidinol-phosphate transaminase [Nocardia cyriacigeorgica]MBF6094912.1 histidinol-phosphate transaminase [Nocardia cyriacigeorgica]MBF6498043.1 histidinol-phosphate transaminase [Nocardia cyriacigeorgica]
MRPVAVISDAIAADTVSVPAEAATVTLADLPLRESLRGHTPYGAPQHDIAVRLNTNESPHPPSTAMIDDLLAAIRAVAAELHRYPDRDALALRADLAAYVTRRTGVEVSADNIWAANGSTEILHQLLLAFGGPGRRALGITPSYAMYRIAAECLGTAWLSVGEPADSAPDIEQMVTAITEYQPDIVFVTTPHNPTGALLARSDLERLLHIAPGLVIVDEAYGEFSATPSAIGLIEEYPAKLVVTRSLSKALAFAGARVGYLVATPAVIEAMLLVRLPYHLSTLGQTAARVALRHADEALARAAEVVAERQRVSRSLHEMGFRVRDSEANFLLFGPFPDPPRAWQRYREHGVLIRDVGIPRTLRVTIGSPEENDRFLAVSAGLLTGESH